MNARSIIEAVTAQTAAPNYLYHVTYANRLDDIEAHGLQPDMPRSIGAPSYDSHARGRVFMGDAKGVSLWLQRAEEFANANADYPQEEGLVPVVLRVRSDDLDLEVDAAGTRDSGGGKAWFTSGPVASELLEVWNGSAWGDLVSIQAGMLDSAFDEEGGFVRKTACPLWNPPLQWW